MAQRLQEQVGRVLAGRYRIIAPIGSGSSGRVFLADDVTLRRRVAIKVLHSALATDSAFLRRFQAEAQAVAALNHPNIMRVFDWGETEEGPFVVLEYLGGGSLRDLLDTGFQLSPSQALLTGLEAARALDYAHRRGLVHRDIKPANLIFDDEGRLCVADFGIARALAEAAWTEPSGAILGTARYAAPEQVQGTAIDGKADVYALSLVLIESVTGNVPFSSDTTIATLMARVNTQLAAPEEMGPLAPTIEKATAIDPTERIDAGEFAKSLNETARELPAPEKLPIVGTQVGEETIVVDRDTTMIGTRPRVADFGSTGLAQDGVAVMQPGAVDELSVHPESWWERQRLRAAERRRMVLRRRDSANKILIIAACLAAMAIGILAIGPQLRPQHPVPKLIGKPLSEAVTSAHRYNFHVVVNSTRYSNLPFDYVISQAPSHGKLHEGDTIGVVISKGAPPRLVPNLGSKSETDANAALTAAGFKVQRVGRRDANVPKGFVLDWSPRGKQPKGTTITLIVSDGPPLVPVPDLAGKTKDQATAALQAVNLTANFTQAFSDTVDIGHVISTSPSSGAGAERSSAVTVVLSQGPELVTIPNVIGENSATAANQLQAAGFEVGEIFGPPGKSVFSTDPSVGTKAKRGTSVNLYTK
jgi:hypothetical protein